MAVVLAGLSLYVMWMSAKLPIGWTPGVGPGGGAFPFWLAVGMLLCCLTIMGRWFWRLSPMSRSTETYMTPQAMKLFFLGVGSLAVTIGMFHVVGVYVAVPLFMVFYLRVVGRHGWRLIAAMSLSASPILFIFFEVTLQIILPKGITEPLFYPLYRWIY
jgi:hypothetical protein